MQMNAEERINILLVDDRPENLISLEAILDHPTYRLVKAGSGQEALRCILDDDFALILLDVQMPVMDGFDTASMIKKREKSRHIPIIFITALTPEKPLLFRGYDAGAVDCITKPFDPFILRSKVAVFADLYSKTKQLERQNVWIADQSRIDKEAEVARIELESLKREWMINQKYRDLVDGITDGIVWISDLDLLTFTFVSAQAEKILGSTTDSRSFEGDLVTSSPLLAHRKAVLDALNLGMDFERNFTFEHQMKDSGGRIFWFKTSVRVADGATNNRYEMRGLSVDITQIKVAQEEALKAIRIRDEFLSIASHELKTPLTPLRLQLEILQRLATRAPERTPLIEKVSLSLEKSRRQIDRLNRLIDELLDVAKINHGKLILEQEEVNLSELVKDVCDRYGSYLNRSTIDLRFNLAQQILGSWDRLKMEQVIINLLTNAVKYGAGKPIEISTAGDPELAILTIRDHGIGIKTEDQSRIFDLFERAASPINFGGLGLGLYITRQIVRAHGGEIEIHSQPQEGAMFIVRIPKRKRIVQPVAC